MTESKTTLVTGATGLVGQRLCRHLKQVGHTVRTLSRGSSGDFQWDPAKGRLPGEALAGVDAIVHLAGESVAQRWTAEVKRRILESRVQSTALIARKLLEGDSRPDFISASGINFYGYDQDEPRDEGSSSGRGFLAEVCRQWEEAAAPLEKAGCRCVYLRTGVVLSRQGGALAKMLPPFRAGVGGRVGDGRQAMSWIALDDLIRIYALCLEDPELFGPLNAVAPEPVTNRTFAQTLGKVLGRPAFIPLPAFAVRSMFGEMGRETILSNLTITPGKLINSGFDWSFPQLEAALTHSLNS
ncbi:MAG: TIGR01777 family oxidoreductase [Opitutales bacterium]